MKTLCLLLLLSTQSLAQGFIPPTAEEMAQRALPVLSDVALPDNYDLRLVPGGLPPVRDQGLTCGSCWSFATTGVLETMIAIKEHRHIHLSEQQLLSCNKHQFSCRGGGFSFDMLENPGQTLASNFPYSASDEPCRENLPVAERVATWYFIGDGQRPPSVNQLKQAIFQNGPIGATVFVNKAMTDYKSGVFTGCEDHEANHLVVLVGWEGDHWLMRNSYGEAWGEHGYGKIPYGCSRIGEYAATAVLKR